MSFADAVVGIRPSDKEAVTSSYFSSQERVIA